VVCATGRREVRVAIKEANAEDCKRVWSSIRRVSRRSEGDVEVERER